MPNDEDTTADDAADRTPHERAQAVAKATADRKAHSEVLAAMARDMLRAARHRQEHTDTTGTGDNTP